MKTLKFSSILCIILAFVYCNANAQKPIVENHEVMTYTIDPSPDLPCVTESTSGNIVMDGFWTNSSRWAGVYNYTYHEIGEGTLTGETTGEYQMRWTYNAKEMSFYDGFPKQSIGFAHSTVTHNGKPFMTINWQYIYIWNEPWTYPIVVHDAFKPECKCK
jgi:hypothetical protein